MRQTNFIANQSERSKNERKSREKQKKYFYGEQSHKIVDVACS